MRNKMFRLFFLFSVISVISASIGQDYGDGKQWYADRMKEKNYVQYEFRTCEVSKMNTDLYKSLGIQNRIYNFTEYARYNVDEMEQLLLKYQGPGFAEQIQLAKNAHPELTHEIDHYTAMTIKKTFAYLQVVREEIRERRNCINLDICKTTLAQYEAIYLLNELEQKADDLILKLGAETPTTLRKAIDLLDGSKVLGLYCNSKCVKKHYVQWGKNCIEGMQPSVTVAPVQIL